MKTSPSKSFTSLTLVALAMGSTLLAQTGPNGTVSSINLLKNGSALIAGDFTRYNTQANAHLAQLNPDGSLDAQFAPEIDSGVQVAHETPQGAIYLAGTFQMVSGVARSGLARLNADGTLDATFANVGLNGRVQAIQSMNDGSVVLGGSFTVVNGVEAPYLVRLDSKGGIAQTFGLGKSEAFEQGVEAILVQADGKMLIAGTFDLSGAFSHVARLNADGLIDQTFQMAQSGWAHVKAIQTQKDGRIVVGGHTSSGGLIRSLNDDGSADGSFTEVISGGGVETLAIDAGGNIYLGGAFGHVNAIATGPLARLSTTGTVDTNFSGRISGAVVESVALTSTGQLLVGGAFTVGREFRYFTRLQVTPRALFSASTHTVAADFTTTLSVEAGHTYEIQVTSDLQNWSRLSTTVATSNVLRVVDADGAAHGARFYRAMLVQ